MKLNSIVRVAGRGNTAYEIVDLSSPVREGDILVRDRNGAMLSIKPSRIKR